jgi:hypothetical protein
MMTQRDQLVHGATPAVVSASLSTPVSQRGRKVKLKPIAEDSTSPFIIQLKRPRTIEEGDVQLLSTPVKPESEIKKRNKKSSEASGALAPNSSTKKRNKKSSEASGASAPNSSTKKKPSSEKREKKDADKKRALEYEEVEEEVVAEASDEKRVSVLRFVGTPDDSAVPLRGTPPEWLFHSWQGAMLVKIPSFPTWPCRIGSTLDLSEFPAASEVPDVQKEAFVFFFGDRTVAWVRYDALSPWPAAGSEDEDLAKIPVPKKHAKLWQAGCDEAKEWNRNVALLPPCPAPIDKDPLTSIMQPIAKGGKKKSVKKYKKKKVVESPAVQVLSMVHDPAAPKQASSRPARTAATASARQRHLKKDFAVGEREKTFFLLMFFV